ncbi:hypothetical protein G7Y89_g15552 [Cudoniella acicularis]|uniref:Uncharacterized protein n=1 Tax=Cudoniella acicularis TaxID=354080 RepID=A0A8H4VJ44_9HELO|nr:hypothetical protein G7Y89_g15552 [Cudoniella acicularis]
MHTPSITQLMALALLATPLVSSFTIDGASDISKREYIVSNGSTSISTYANFSQGGNANLAALFARHHTEAQIAAKKAKAGARDVDTREPHHTEAQIAAKKAKAGARDVEGKPIT